MKKLLKNIDVTYWLITIIWTFIFYIDTIKGIKIITDGENPLILLILLPIVFSKKSIESKEYVANTHITDTHAIGFFIYALHYLNYILFKFSIIYIPNSAIMVFILICAVIYKISKYILSKNG